MKFTLPSRPTVDIFSGEVSDRPLNMSLVKSFRRYDGQVNGVYYYAIYFAMIDGLTNGWHFATEDDRETVYKELLNKNDDG